MCGRAGPQQRRATLGHRQMPPIFHFTDIANLAGIVETDELRCHRDAPTSVEVGSTSIKASRAQIQVDCGPGGKVCDYVPFYYAPRSPMLNTIMRGNVEGVSTDQGRLIYLVSSTEALYAAGLACVFTDGNAAAAFTKFCADPTALATTVDWQLMKERYWANTQEDPDRRRRRMAEFLVYEAVPLELFKEVGVRDARGAALVAEQGLETTVRVRESWYF